MAGKDKPKFIRKNGRIIPIGPRDKSSKSNSPQNVGKKSIPKAKDRQNVGKGLAFIASGAAIAGLSGFAAGRLFKSAARAGKKSIERTATAKFAFSHDHGGSELGERVGKIMFKGAAREAAKTRKRVAQSQFIFKAGAGIFGSLLIGQGISNIAESIKGEELGDAGEIASQAAGFATTAVATAAFKKGATSALIKKVLSKGKL